MWPVKHDREAVAFLALVAVMVVLALVVTCCDRAGGRHLTGTCGDVLTTHGAPSGEA